MPNMTAITPNVPRMPIKTGASHVLPAFSSTGTRTTETTGKKSGKRSSHLSQSCYFRHI